MHNIIYHPEDWYWHVLQTDEIYASKRRQVIVDSDAGLQAFLLLNQAVTRIDNWSELTAVLKEQAPGHEPLDLRAYAAELRWRLEVSGIVVSGLNVDTSRESQALIHGAVTMAQTDPGFSFKFKSTTGFVDLNAETIRAVGAAVAGHVQSCFAWEAETISLIEAGSIVRETDIDARAALFETVV